MEGNRSAARVLVTCVSDEDGLLLHAVGSPVSVVVQGNAVRCMDSPFLVSPVVALCSCWAWIDGVAVVDATAD